METNTGCSASVLAGRVGAGNGVGVRPSAREEGRALESHGKAGSPIPVGRLFSEVKEASGLELQGPSGRDLAVAADHIGRATAYSTDTGSASTGGLARVLDRVGPGSGDVDLAADLASEGVVLGVGFPFPSCTSIEFRTCRAIFAVLIRTCSSILLSCRHTCVALCYPSQWERRSQEQPGKECE